MLLAIRISHILGAPNYASSIQNIERYQNGVFVKCRRIMHEYDKQVAASGDYSLLEKANEEMASVTKELTIDTLDKVLQTASEKMKNGYNRADN